MSYFSIKNQVQVIFLVFKIRVHDIRHEFIWLASLPRKYARRACTLSNLGL